jgi:hypothetical protein
MDRLYDYCFSTLLYNVPPGRFKKTKRGWNCMGHMSFWFMLITVYWEKTYTS